MAQQYGLITRLQALNAGLSERQIERRLATGAWRVFHPGVFAALEYPIDWRQRALAACLWAGVGVALSHRSAARLWSLEGISDDVVEITTARRLRSAEVIIHQSRLPAEMITRVAGIPVTPMARTLLDLAAVVSPARFEVALDDALRRRLTSPKQLASEIGTQGRGRPGARALRTTLDRYQHRPLESPLERRFLKLLRAANLPEPIAQHEVTLEGRVVARIDFAYPELKLGIEIDGYRWHSGRRHWARDVGRQNELITLEWRTLHLTAEHMSGRGIWAINVVRRARDAAMTRRAMNFRH